MPKLVYHDSDGVDKVLNLGAEALLIGRATECEIQTQDAMVSRRHARISWDGGYWIEDLGSSNGVYVGNEKVKKAQFRPGDTVTCGSLVMRMLPDSAPRTAIPADALTQPPPRMDRERQRVPTLPPPPPAPPLAGPTDDTSALALDREKKRCNDLELEVAELKRQLAASTSKNTAITGAPAPSDPQIADTIILLSDAVASVRSNLRLANGEATLLKQPEESAQVVRDSLRTAAEALEQARQHLRSLAKLLGL